MTPGLERPGKPDFRSAVSIVPVPARAKHSARVVAAAPAPDATASRVPPCGWLLPAPEYWPTFPQLAPDALVPRVADFPSQRSVGLLFLFELCPAMKQAGALSRLR